MISNESMILVMFKVQPENYQEVRTIMKILLLSENFIGLPFGICLFLGIIHFERYGGDPMKRSIYNMMISLLCFETILFVFPLITALTIRVFFGTFPTIIALLMSFHNFYAIIRECLLIMEICLIKNLHIYKFQKAASLNDPFWFAFTFAFNLVIGFFLSLADCYQSGKQLTDFDLLTKDLFISIQPPKQRYLDF